MKTILLTGGTGYIASHTAVILQQAGYDVVLFDNLSHSCKSMVDNIAKITGTKPHFYQGDVCNTYDLDYVFNQYTIDGVIHFAALKSVPESFEKTEQYHKTNVMGTNTLLQSMSNHNVSNIVFSSSAAVYGNPEYLPIDENHPTNTINPYAETKRMAEQSIQQWGDKNSPKNKCIILRYFNPVGAHHSHTIGENFADKPTNLVSHISLNLQGKKQHIEIFGTELNTPDGSPIRDYIHIMDLAEAHLSALQNIPHSDNWIINIGTGQGHSVYEVLHSFASVTNKNIPQKPAPQRQGDPISVYADVSQAQEKLDWHSKRDLNTMVYDHVQYLNKKQHPS